ncbi:haloacid dehalogenase-like hydrolase [Neisseriaceae bacterium CLB008]
MSTTPTTQMDLSAWPEDAATRLCALIQRHAHQGEYAVFDADQTCYQHDLTEPLLAYLERQGLISQDTLAAELKLLPFLNSIGAEPESLYSYYTRLCALDANIGYAWIAQSFAGLSLGQLKASLDAMLAAGQALPVRTWLNGNAQSGLSHPPRMVLGMQQLIAALQQHGIAVYIVSAGLEEAVRMLLADPQYGYHVPAEHVIGVTTLLRDPHTGDVTTARQRMAAGSYRTENLDQHHLTTQLLAPLTWAEGKVAAIKTHIDAVRQPILVAGDTPDSDGPMLFDATDLKRGGLRLFIDRSACAVQRLHIMQAQRAVQQAAAYLPVSAHDGWLLIAHQQLMGANHCMATL